MARYTYLERRGATYYARMDIPVDLVDFYGTTTRKKSLRTKDEATAKTLLWPLVEAWQAEFADVRMRRDITSDDKSAATWEHYEATLAAYDLKQRNLPSPEQIDAEEKSLWRRIDAGEIGAHDFVGMINSHANYELMLRARKDDANVRSRRLVERRKALVSGDMRAVEPAVQSFIAKNRLLVTVGSDEYRELCTMMMRAEIEGLERTLERDRGDYTGVPKDPIVKPAKVKAREAAAPGETIMDLFERYAAENPRGIATDTIAQARRDVRSFVDFVGTTCPVHRIDKKAVREWKALLMRYPVKATESAAFAGMSLSQIVKHNEKVGKPVISHTTVNRYLSGLSAFCSWLVNHGYLDTNPADGMSLKKLKDRTTVPFTVDQLNGLLRSPLFTGCASADEWRNLAKPGDVRVTDHRYWIPLIMLFSGARPAEIAQLSVSDVRQEHGVWIMHITSEGDGEKSVKTAGSMRVVPIHSELLKLGFIEYRDEMASKGETRLFPDAKRNSRGQMAADFSREFGRYLTRIKLKEGRGLSLYSFRHGVADALRRAGHLDEQFGFILGHTAGTMTGRYGILPQGMLKQRVDLVESIAYPGLSLDHLQKAI